MSKLFSNFKIKDMELKNRLVMAPMCMDSSDEMGFSNSWHYIHYVTRAIGGVGLIILEATGVTPGGCITNKDLGLWDDAHIENLKNIVDECHNHGAKVGIQISHAGRKSEVIKEDILAPSAIAFNENYRIPKEMTINDIKDIIKAFKDAAQRALKSGFDLLELHCAHGYLIGEFLSPLTNNRNDEYGGSVENRVRFLKEVIKEVKTVWPSHKPLAIRVSAEDYATGGNNSDTIAEIINLVKEENIDLVDVSTGGVVPAKINIYPGYQIKSSEIIKEKCKIPTIAGGLITTALACEEILNNNRADLVYLGRELLRNPYWAIHAAKELEENIKVPVQYERSIYINKNGF